MKLKSIIACGIALLSIGAATTSCEDMFTADNKLVTTDLAPKDTVYQVMGIINRMQKLADRTVLLGELRGDLVTVDPAHASTHLQELGANRVTVDNIYNQPADYYDVINNCNIYLAHVDSLHYVHGKYFYKNEIIAVKTFRAWCYLELAKIYGKVPFVTTPVLDPLAAEKIVASTGDHKDLEYITTWLINDLKDYAYEPENYSLIPGYTADASTTYKQYFIPVRVMLGELYLWRGSFTGSQADYIDAVRMYHNFLTWKGEEKATGGYMITFGDNADFESISTSYSENCFAAGGSALDNFVAVLPLDTIEFNGTVGDVRSVFCSAPKNNYYPAATMSDRLDAISYGQIVYNLKRAIGSTPAQALPAPRENNNWVQNSHRVVGDLRLRDILTERNVVDKYNSANSRVRTYVSKWLFGNSTINTDERANGIWYYRYTTIYLHMAEALNRAGFPETAFAVLKWGITEETLRNREVISQVEFDRLAEIRSYANTNATATLYDATGSFLVWPVDAFVPYDKLSAATVGSSSLLLRQVGIHSKGSGDAEYNPTYTLPTTIKRWDDSHPMPTYTPQSRDFDDPADFEAAVQLYNDSIEAYEQTYATNLEWQYEDNKAERMEYVAKRILDEEALELCYEGTRFYDLMRYVRQEGDMSNTVNYPAYISQPWQPDGRGGYGPCPAIDNKYNGTSWYLPLPKR